MTGGTPSGSSKVLDGIDSDDSFGDESSSKGTDPANASKRNDDFDDADLDDLAMNYVPEPIVSQGAKVDDHVVGLNDSFEFTESLPASRKTPSGDVERAVVALDSQRKDSRQEVEEMQASFEFSDTTQLASLLQYQPSSDHKVEKYPASEVIKEENEYEDEKKLDEDSFTESLTSSDAFEFSENDDEVLAMLDDAELHSQSPQKESPPHATYTTSIKRSASSPSQSSPELKRSTTSQSQTQPVKAPARSRVCKFIITSSSSSSSPPRGPDSQSSQAKPSQPESSPVDEVALENPANITEKISPPETFARPSTRISSFAYKPYKPARPQSRNYSTVPRLEQPSKTPVNHHTILLATQRPTVEKSKTPECQHAKKVVQPIILSKEQEVVLQKVLSGVSLFYTGSAGTGKSVLLRSIIKALRRRYPTGVAVTASTGLAACNIGGITLHSFGAIGLGTGTVDNLVKKIKRNKKAHARWRDTRVLIIDEVSMVDGELLDKLNEIAKRLRKNDVPFGGIQLVACGDFYQLPPVVKKINAEGDTRDDVEAFFSFECLAWKETIQETIILKEIFRQKGDQVFINMLNEMRDGRISDRTVDEFRRLARPLECPAGISPAELFATRNEVERANKRRLDALPGEKVSYRAIDSGSLPEPQKSSLLSNFLAPQELELKKDAQVMCVKNFDETLVNGSLGTVVDFIDKDTYMKAFKEGDHLDDEGKLKDFIFNDPDSSIGLTTGSLTQKVVTHDGKSTDDRKTELNNDLLGDFKNRKFPLVKFLSPDGVNSRTVLVEPEQWNVEDEDGRALVSRVQFPLMLAWSLSIHKSQGQTLSRVKVDLKSVFETGQSYVALSRATSRDGLQVLNFNEHKVRSHPKVVDFYKSLVDINKAHSTGQQKLNFNPD
ncbi:PIF1 [Candida theae]|uniref:ATP-dependent DNA helicase PIF1 n=1 Tax=Candida theae TaxID=1198502 RepID=A0AAD5BBM1_9ASCO|nr:PIF1 [Candida theae]KAI5952086.1 PIF1 [Candida theae]